MNSACNKSSITPGILKKILTSMLPSQLFLKPFYNLSVGKEIMIKQV